MEYQGTMLMIMQECPVCGRQFGTPYKREESGRKWGYMIPIRKREKIRYVRVCSYTCQKNGAYTFKMKERKENRNG